MVSVTYHFDHITVSFLVPIVPHAGGVGLCEMVPHLSYFDYIAVSGKMSMCEFADHLHEHFTVPVKISQGKYVLPLVSISIVE